MSAIVKGDVKMFAKLLIALLLLASAVCVSSSVSAGGWASVRMLEGVPNPVVGLQWRASLVVKQHDVTEVDVDELAIQFVHQATGATLDALGVSTGEVGHYTVDMTFEKLGLWNWSATPSPFAATNMPSLEVVASSLPIDANAPIVSLVGGTCMAPGDSLGDLTLSRSETELGVTIASGLTPNRALLTKDVAGGSVAVLVRPATDSATLLACGELDAISLEPPKVVVIAPAEESDWSGTLSLLPVGMDLVASLTLIAPTSSSAMIRITGMSDGAYEPRELTIPVGATVTWINDSSMAHTISGGAPGFRNSGLIDPGQTFSQTFTQPGTFHYVCDPHPWMIGVVIVTD